MATLLREVCQLHREMVPSAQIAERFASARLPMTGDPKLLFQVFSNVLSNAVKYSPGGGVIDVEAELGADEIIVVINDRGIGIPTGDVERLFERYYRGSNVSGIVGTGVGLYLVKMVVDLHGGRVEVKGEEGSGSRFTIRLPLVQASTALPSTQPLAGSTIGADAPTVIASLSPNESVNDGDG